MVQPTPLSTAAIGLDFRPRRTRRPRRSVSPPLAVLALFTLGLYWCSDSRRRVPAGATFLLTVALVMQLLHAGSIGHVDFTTLSLRLPSLSLPSILTAPSIAPALAPATPASPALAETASSVLSLPAPSAGAAPAAVASSAPAAARVPWQPANLATSPYPAHIETWRPLVRELIAEAAAEGRLDGPASRLDDDLVLALIRQESQGNPDALSWAGAMGLMQVMPFTFADMMAGDRSLTCAIDTAAMWDVRSNVRAGLRYLTRALTVHEGNLYWALASYNAGIDAVHDWRAAGLYAVPPAGGYWETADYAQVILRDYLRRRPDVAPLIHLPDPMPVEHVPGALRQLRDLDTQRGGPRPPEYIPRCPR